MGSRRYSRGPNLSDILWSFPAGRTIPTPWLQQVLGWLRSSENHIFSLPIIGSHAGRLDLARSFVIQTGKDNPRFSWLLSFDTDVVFHPDQSPDSVIEILDSDAASGFGVINGLTLDKTGNPQVGAPLESWAQVTRHEPMRGVLYFAWGFVAISRAALDAIQPISFIDLPGPTGKNVRVPLYCRQLEKETEDSDLCQTFKKSGVEITTDPRLRVGHIKDAEFYLDPNEYVRWARNARVALKDAEIRRDTTAVLATPDLR